MSDLPAFKKFVSEDELNEQRKKRQEEWENVRRPDQPLEAPEEEHDPRSLYDRLQEQKDKKQQEYEETFKLKNQVKGLEGDEVEFLNFVSEKQTEIDKAREQENEEVLAEYRNAVLSTVPDKSKTSPEKKSAKPAPGPSHSKKSQSSLLSGAVKRKRSDAEVSQESKVPKTSDTPDSGSDVEEDGQMARVIGILPGMGAYSGTSSESDTSSSDDENDIDTRMFSKKVVHVYHGQKH